jgi:hypothetical protein
VPFVQGQLRGAPLSSTVRSDCAHCGQALHLEIDSELNYRVLDEGANPLVRVPLVDLDKLEDPSIIDAF